MCHVLIIEDDALAAHDIHATVVGAGATTVSFADTEREAVRAARESRPAVIISDVMLATGFGPEAVSAIRAEHGPVPVIFLTGTPELCGDADGPHILAKPFSAASLASLFRAVAPAA